MCVWRVCVCVCGVCVCCVCVCGWGMKIRHGGEITTEDHKNGTSSIIIFIQKKSGLYNVTH
jgi:hypothetical protein